MHFIIPKKEQDPASIKRGIYLFLDKHVKSVKKSMCYGICIHSIGELETCQKRYYASCSFFSVLQPKIHHLSYADVGMSTPGIKTTDRRINAFFHLKGDFTKKNVNLGTISAMHTTNRQGFK